MFSVAELLPSDGGKKKKKKLMPHSLNSCYCPILPGGKLSEAAWSQTSLQSSITHDRLVEGGT